MYIYKEHSFHWSAQSRDSFGCGFLQRCCFTRSITTKKLLIQLSNLGRHHVHDALPLLAFIYSSDTFDLTFPINGQHSGMFDLRCVALPRQVDGAVRWRDVNHKRRFRFDVPADRQAVDFNAQCKIAALFDAMLVMGCCVGTVHTHAWEYQNQKKLKKFFYFLLLSSCQFHIFFLIGSLTLTTYYSF